MEQTNRPVRTGVVVGVIGYASVAAFYAVFDLLAARGALYTVDLLGKAVFRGLRDPSILGLPIQIDWGAVFWYNLLHLVAALIIGLIVVGLVEAAIKNPPRSAIVFYTIILGFAVTIAAIAVLTLPIRPLLPWWSIVVANSLAVVIGSVYLLRRYPGIWDRLIPFASGHGDHRAAIDAR